MIRYVIDLLQEGVREIRRYPQLQLSMLLVVLLPFAFLFAGHAFLDAGRSNQDYLQTQSIHTIHQSLHTLVQTTRNDVSQIQSAAAAIVEQNDEFAAVRVLIRQGDMYVVVASSHRGEIDSVVPSEGVYNQSLGYQGETLHYQRELEGAPYLWSIQASQPSPGVTFVTETEYDLGPSQQIFMTGTLQAYLTLVAVFILIILIAYWHIRTTSYQDLYEYTRNVLHNRQRFTHMIAHELRAPLTAIRGYASMLQESNALNEKQSEQAEQIQHSAERVLSIVAELLEVAQIQSGKIAVNTDTVDLAQLVTRSLNELRPLTKDKKITLSQAGVLQGAEVETDAKRVQQILINLVSNAIKYSDEGLIEIEIKHLHAGYELRVKDSGLGISAENQRKLFAPFFQVQEQKEYDALGVGLGMWITRQYIDVIGATVDVESIAGVGTHIVIAIPKEFTENNL